MSTPDTTVKIKESRLRGIIRECVVSESGSTMEAKRALKRSALSVAETIMDVRSATGVLVTSDDVIDHL